MCSQIETLQNIINEKDNLFLTIEGMLSDVCFPFVGTIFAEQALELADELDEIIEGGALLLMVAVVGEPPWFPALVHPCLCFNYYVKKIIEPILRVSLS